VRVSRRQKFVEDVSEAHIFLVPRSRNAADRLLDDIERLAELLSRFPEVGKRRAQLGDGVRSFPLRRMGYIVFYRVEQDRVMLLRLLHGARRVRRGMMGG
jgi:toxin ParE1/3/4